MDSHDAALPALLVLGSYHMNNPGRDAFNVEADDVLQPRRQQEIGDVVARLGRFRPTAVAIEMNWRAGAEWQRDYEAFRAGAFALTRDERHQIGFRVAADAGVGRVTAVDWDWDAPAVTAGFGDNPWEYAAAHQPDLHRRIEQEGRALTAEMTRRLASDSVREVLRWLNTPEAEAANHRTYLGLLALVGEPSAPVGVWWLAGWYQRNLNIFTNLVRLAASPRDRVFVIIGSGHVPLIRQFAELSGLFQVEDALDYL